MEPHLLVLRENTSARGTLSGGLHFAQNSKHFEPQYSGLVLGNGRLWTCEVGVHVRERCAFVVNFVILCMRSRM